MPTTPDRPGQMPRLEGIHANLIDRLQEAKEQGWHGEVAAIETTMAAAAQKLQAMKALATRHTTALGMPSSAPQPGGQAQTTDPRTARPPASAD